MCKSKIFHLFQLYLLPLVVHIMNYHLQWVHHLQLLYHYH
nr:MAG TPA: hypothetical protein [Caudoviricetes sp.]